MSDTDPIEKKSPESPVWIFEAGQKIAGCYTLKRRLESAGSLTGWLAHDEELDKDITLHFLPASVVADARAMTELRQETKRNRQLIHPHIVRVHDLIEEAEWVAISMDHSDGENLAALLSKRPKHHFDVSEIKGWVAQLCQTLEDAHKVELLHRDLVPDNILVTTTGDLALMNFGITRVVSDSLERSGQKGVVDRTLAYTSPQLLDGERPARPDDIYALGALIFELLTGGPPFRGGDLISQIRKTVPPAISARRAELKILGEQIPKNWDREVGLCLDKHSPARPKTALEVASRLGLDRHPGPVTNLETALAGAGTTTSMDSAPGGKVEAASADAPSKVISSAAPTTGEKVEKAARSGKPHLDKAPASKGSAQLPAAEKPPAGKAPPTASKPMAKMTADRGSVTEAEIVSKTVIPQASEEFSTESAVEVSKAPPKVPLGREFPHSAFVTLEDQKKRAQRKARMPMAVMAGAAVLLILGVIAYTMSGGA
ncbi:MAG: protein kinase, partial [Armatimonadetes bacterium]|nr:protein kinase [Akkermansiaceae bacterium]